MNQEQVKNKTFNWCKKLYENGLFDENNYNDCIASFNHDHQGEIPGNLKKSRTGIENSYGLYNRTENYISESNPENLDQKMYITTYNGKYLGCNKDGKFYLASDFQNSNINQSELEWSIISLEDNRVAILNSNMLYLNVNIDSCVKAEGDTINASTKFEMKHIDKDIYLISELFPDKKLSFHIKKNFVELKVESGLNENSIWNLIPIKNGNSNNQIKEFDENNFVAEKRKQINLYIKGKKIQILVSTEIFILRQLLHKIRTNINTIKKHIDNIFENSVSTYRSLSGKYIDQLNSLDDYRRRLMTTNLDNYQYSVLSQSINKLENKLNLTDKVNMNRKMKEELNKELLNYRDECTRDINKLISDREEYLKRQKLNNIDESLNSFINKLEIDIDTLKNKNNQNNRILIKQSKMIDDNQQEIMVQEKEIKNYENKDTALQQNLEVIEHNINELNNKKIYKIIALIIVICLVIYLSYKTYKNLKLAYFS